MRNDDRCVCCGAYVPEGRQVCIKCEKVAETQEDSGRLNSNDAFHCRKEANNAIKKEIQRSRRL